MRADLRERLTSGRALVADGATGTQLYARGMTPGGCSEAWNTENPAAVTDVAACYAQAGSDLVYTNSFGGNRWRLGHYGLADRLEELNEKAASLARAGVGEDVYVVGSMGPTGDFLAPLGMLEPDEVQAAYAQQAAALVAGGADGLVLETFAALDEIAAAVRGARSVTDKPILATLTYGAGLRTMMGISPQVAIAELVEAGADVVGLNCGDEIDVVVPVLEAYAGHGVQLMAKPNAGMPVIVDGQPTWPIPPVDFAERARVWLQTGARIVGGCCGTSPAYVTALAKMVRG
ncbi:MAG: homocysteine S-methyltransferase family protein [Armatimonadetes bacterium]|nr:homocysteine S-methyltransferase family protein [Armatimonadota bacterium]